MQGHDARLHTPHAHTTTLRELPPPCRPRRPPLASAAAPASRAVCVCVCATLGFRAHATARSAVCVPRRLCHSLLVFPHRPLGQPPPPPNGLLTHFRDAHPPLTLPSPPPRRLGRRRFDRRAFDLPPHFSSSSRTNASTQRVPGRCTRRVLPPFSRRRRLSFSYLPPPPRRPRHSPLTHCVCFERARPPARTLNPQLGRPPHTLLFSLPLGRASRLCVCVCVCEFGRECAPSVCF